MKPAKPCENCLGSGKNLPTEPPWDRFLPGACASCGGAGILGAVPLRTLHVGDLFAYRSGREHVIVRKNADGCVVVEQRARFAHCRGPDREQGSPCPCATPDGLSCGRPAFLCTACSKVRATEAAKRVGVWAAAPPG